MAIVKSKHDKSNKQFNILNRKISLAAVKKKNDFYKKVEGFVPSSTKYMKDYLISEEEQNLKILVQRERPMFVETIYDLKSVGKSNYFFDNSCSFGELDSSRSKHIDSTNKTKKGKSNFNILSNL